MHLWNWNSISKVLGVDLSTKYAEDYRFLKSKFESIDAKNYPVSFTIDIFSNKFTFIVTEEMKTDTNYVYTYDHISRILTFFFKNETDMILFKLKYL